MYYRFLEVENKIDLDIDKDKIIRIFEYNRYLRDFIKVQNLLIMKIEDREGFWVNDVKYLIKIQYKVLQIFEKMIIKIQKVGIFVGCITCSNYGQLFGI